MRPAAQRPVLGAVAGGRAGCLPLAAFRVALPDWRPTGTGWSPTIPGRWSWSAPPEPTTRRRGDGRRGRGRTVYCDDDVSWPAECGRWEAALAEELDGMAAGTPTAIDRRGGHGAGQQWPWSDRRAAGRHPSATGSTASWPAASCSLPCPFAPGRPTGAVGATLSTAAGRGVEGPPRAPCPNPRTSDPATVTQPVSRLTRAVRAGHAALTRDDAKPDCPRPPARPTLGRRCTGHRQRSRGRRPHGHQGDPVGDRRGRAGGGGGHRGPPRPRAGRVLGAQPGQGRGRRRRPVRHRPRSAWPPPTTSTRCSPSGPTASSTRRSWPTRRWWPGSWHREPTW